MPEIRAITFMVPPMLAELIQFSLNQRLHAQARFAIVAQLANATELHAQAQRHRANIIILGPQASLHFNNQHLPAGIAVLRLSADLRCIYALDETAAVPFTGDALAELLGILLPPV